MSTFTTARLVRVFFFLAIVLLPAVARGGTIDPATPDTKYIEFGKEFPMVARIMAPTMVHIKTGRHTEKKSAVLFGSAVIIKPNWVLTAAHIIDDAMGLPVILADEHKPREVTYLVLHSDFDKKIMGRNDIALCFCPNAFDLPFYVDLYRNTDELNKPVTIAGFGNTGTFKTGATKTDMHKRAGHNSIDDVDTYILSCSPSINNRFPLEFMIAPGDSGGGLFIGNAVAGINSYVASTRDSKADASYGDIGFFTRISAYAPWIDEAIARHAAANKKDKDGLNK